MKSKIGFWVLVLAILGIVFIAGCAQQGNNPEDNSQAIASEQGRPPTASRECPSQYDGTYQGIFTYRYRVPIEGKQLEFKEVTDGFRVSVTLECDRISDEPIEDENQVQGIWLKVTKVMASHPDFDCLQGCVPLALPASYAFLPLEDNKLGMSNRGQEIFIVFPNGMTLMANPLISSLDGMILSSTLETEWQGNTFNVFGGPVAFPSEMTEKGGLPSNDGEFQSWKLSKTT